VELFPHSPHKSLWRAPQQIYKFLLILFWPHSGFKLGSSGYCVKWLAEVLNGLSLHTLNWPLAVLYQISRYFMKQRISHFGVSQWRTERGGLGCSNPPPPEIPNISAESSIAWERRAGVSISFWSSLCSHTVVIY